jgi:hypothetical protein
VGANNNLTTLNGLFLEVYASKLENLIPDGVKLLNMVPFVSRQYQEGSLYHQPVVLGLEHGVTYSTGGDAFTLNAAIAGQIKDAQVQGAQLVLRSILSYTAASRSVGGGTKAFEDATKFLVGNMLRSISRKLEMELFYGGVGIGKLAASGAISGLVITLDTAEWAPGVWAGAEGMPINFRTSGGTDHGSTTITSVDMDARTITVASAMSAANADIIYVDGSYGNEMSGVHKILTNTTTLFNIDAAAYNLWKGNQFACGSAALSFTKIQQAVARAVEKGLDSEVIVLVNPRGWANLLSDQAALRKYDSSYKPNEAANGAESVKFYGQNGVIEIQPSTFVKEGYAYILCKDDWMRIGSTDVTFKRPGQGEEFFRDLESAAGYELRCFTDQAIFCSAPGKQVLMTGVVNS